MKKLSELEPEKQAEAKKLMKLLVIAVIFLIVWVMLR